MNCVVIYILWDPRNNNKCYIGKANSAKKRYYQHLAPSHLKKNTIKQTWLKKLKTLGLKPILEIIDEVNEVEWQFWERHYISLYKSWGFNLTNDPKCLGGEAGPNLKGRKHSEEHKKKLSLLMIERMKDPSERLRRSIKQKGKVISLKHRQQISIKNKGRVVSEETKQKISIAHKGKRLSLETKQRISFALQKKVSWVCFCGKLKTLTPNRAKKQKFCSYKCREKYKRLI